MLTFYASELNAQVVILFQAGGGSTNESATNDFPVLMSSSPQRDLQSKTKAKLLESLLSF
jgi:hypothetical protein